MAPKVRIFFLMSALQGKERDTAFKNAVCISNCDKGHAILDLQK